MTQSDPSIELPAMLGRYELLHEIASGGMATVFVARVNGVAGFERMVAVKRCHAHLRREEEFANMFLDEARLAARIHHPNVVSTIDVGHGEDGSLFLVMELVEGFSLATLHRTAGRRGVRVPVPIALRIMIDALNGLHAAHELREPGGKLLHVIHRDVSPQNILVGGDGVARITDFGVAKAEQRLSETRTGHLKGKLSYMAPEQISANSEITRQADIYPAGVVLWELLTGERLFDGRSDVETLNLVLRGAVRPPSEIGTEVPADLDQIVLRALERDPAKRFETASDLAEALEKCSVHPASARAVGEFVRDLLKDAFTRRRDLIRDCLDSAPILIEQLPSAPKLAAGPAWSERPSVPPTRRVRRRRRAERIALWTTGAATLLLTLVVISGVWSGGVEATAPMHHVPMSMQASPLVGRVADNSQRPDSLALAMPNRSDVIPATGGAEPPVRDVQSVVQRPVVSDVAPNPAPPPPHGSTHSGSSHRSARDANSANAQPGARTTRFIPQSI